MEDNQPEITAPKPKRKWSYTITAGGVIVAIVTFCCGFLSGALLMLSGESSTSATEIPITQIAVTQVVGGPTYTFPPSPEPIQILVTSTFPPDFTEVYRFQGNGRGATDLFTLQNGQVRIKWTFRGDANFIFSLKRLDSGVSVGLENAVGPTEGQYIMNVGSSDQYLFDLEIARGDWEIIVEFRPD